MYPEAMEDILEINPAKELKPLTGLSDVVDYGSPLDVNKGISFKQCCKV